MLIRGAHPESLSRDLTRRAYSGAHQRISPWELSRRLTRGAHHGAHPGNSAWFSPGQLTLKLTQGGGALASSLPGEFTRRAYGGKSPVSQSEEIALGAHSQGSPRTHQVS